ncbi:MAG: LysR family transcriptional regulator [Ktedonobacteraceae bacterium]
MYVLQLQLVEAIARTGNLSKAAEELGITQSAASHSMARLRKDLGDPIFVRTMSGMRATPFGERLAANTRSALDALTIGITSPIEFVPATSQRTFNIIMSDVSQFLYLPALVSHLSTLASHVTIRTRPIPTHAPQLALESGEVDMAVGAFTKLIAGCRQRRLYREQYACVVRQDHPLFENGMNIDAFRRVPQAVVDSHGYVHEQLDHLLGQQRASRKPKLYVPYFVSLLPVLTRSDLLVVMASRLAQAFARLAPLKILAPPIKLPTYNVFLFWHERFNRDPANQWIRSMYIELFGDSHGRKSTEFDGVF